jgi:hypothetical protein
MYLETYDKIAEVFDKYDHDKSEYLNRDQLFESYHIASWSVLRTVLSRIGYCSGLVMLIVILHTL